LKSRSEKSEKFKKIKGKLLETIKTYEEMLENCEDAGERSIINQTLFTLHR